MKSRDELLVGKIFIISYTKCSKLIFRIFILGVTVRKKHELSSVNKKNTLE